MSFTRIHLALLVALISITSAKAFAAGADAGTLDQIFKKQIELEKNEAHPESLIKKKESIPVAPSDADILIEVKEFKVTGMTLFTSEEAQAALSAFNNQKLTLKQINEAGNAIVNLYKKKGRIAQAIVPPQEIKDGIVEIKIIEGKVGSIIIEPAFAQDPPRLSKKVTKKFISYYNAEGQLINLDGLERSLSLLNEIPSVHAEVSLESGQDDGTTNILMKVDELSKLSGRVDLTNYGSASTGYAQAVANINLNDLSGIGDSGSIDVLKSQGSIFAQARYFVPANSDGLRIGVGASTLNYDTLASFSEVLSNGRSSTVGLYSNYALERTPRSNKTVSFNMEHRAYINYTNDVEVSKHLINSATLGLQGNQFVGDASLIWSLSAVYGNLMLNNNSQLEFDKATVKTEGGFGKLSLYSVFMKPLPIKKTSLMLTMNGQLASKNLNSAEQLYLGGPNGVRAYPLSQGGGSQGVILSAEVNHVFENNLEVGVFLDAGLIQQFKHTYQDWRGLTNADNTYALYASGFDAKYRYKKKAEISGAVAYKLGDNPLYTWTGEQLNVDKHERSVQFWLKGSFFF